MAVGIFRALRPLATASNGSLRAATRSPLPVLLRLPSRAVSSAAAPGPTTSNSAAPDAAPPEPLPGAPPATNGQGAPVDWSSSFHGLSTVPFPRETAEILMREVRAEDVEIKPDGIIFLPEIKYRRIMNLAFGPGGWGLAPRGDLDVGDKVVTREYALVVHGRCVPSYPFFAPGTRSCLWGPGGRGEDDGSRDAELTRFRGNRFIAQARGECPYFGPETIPSAGEGCKSNAMMRCCKDLGVASELWDPGYIREFRKKHCHEVWVEHATTKRKRQIWLRKGLAPVYPYVLAKKTTAYGSNASTSS